MRAVVEQEPGLSAGEARPRPLPGSRVLRPQGAALPPAPRSPQGPIPGVGESQILQKRVRHGAGPHLHLT